MHPVIRMGPYLTGEEKPMRRAFSRAVILIVAFIVINSLSCTTAGGPRNGAHRLMRGLYIPNRQANSPDYIRSIIERGKPLGINMLVIDVHPFMVLKARFNPEVISYLKRHGIYIAARIVCFQDGLKSLPVSEEHLDRLFGVMKEAAGAGFDEVQMDYIRFPDGAPYYALSVKYGFIDGLLTKARAIADERGVRLSADLFGRVVYNRDDIIGQKIENFAKHADVIYPMLYPSHFTDDRGRMANPGETVRDGTLRGINRVKGTRAGIQPYIQAFPYNIQWAHVSLDRYVELQVVAAESTGARGWVAWNAKGEYECVFKALERL
jgi:hypothetical protein